MPVISPVNNARGQLDGFWAPSNIENFMDDEPLLMTSMCTLACHLQSYTSCI